ncbi:MULTISPECIES: hypothetical protein [Planktothricoides]|uniref:Uncharacterized protein n=1 Tax=Planktothricoides raciborskii FACHB-1370 TaxID=2949576 RepID=A0ABR8EHQ4_9CYAN|nr:MULTISPECIES: hypothetical protein [Planktothricoides]MBD2545280.1 hypothetical protein [Planktothricoides raciborskii FACHB-1370]MBD2584346.1 hypothetical protein [Planktothricoides raciborskii FACHB-1261]
MGYLRHRTLTVSLILGTIALAVAPGDRTSGATISGTSLAETQSVSEISPVSTSEISPVRSPILAATNVSPEEIEGTWELRDAKRPDNQKYTGTLEIEAFRDTNNLYNLSWETSAGDYTGLGFLEGDRLLVGYGLNEEIYGAVLYKINGDGTLEGRWTYSQANGAVGTEKAIGGIRGKLEGEYRIDGTDPGQPDSTYNGLLRINKVKDIYQVSWIVEDQVLLGVGLRVDDWLIVGWGQGNNFAVMDYKIERDKVKGRSAMSGQENLGKEELRRKN